MYLELSHSRCHGHISRLCVLSLSCDHFNQSYSSKGKITRALCCLMRQNRHYLTLSKTFKQHAYMLLKNLQFCGVRVEYFYDLRRSGYGAKRFGLGVDTESKNETPSISGLNSSLALSAGEL